MDNNGQRLNNSYTANIATYQQREAGFYTNRVQGEWNGKHIMRGKSPSDQSVLLMSNDYLDLAHHPEILKAQSDAILQMGNGLLMSGIFLHGDNPQAELERRFATFLRSESSMLCQSGWCANVGLLQTIADEKTPVYLDILAHMSLWEGVKSAGAKAHYFHHNNMAHLERQIKKHGPGIIAVDALYSTNGSICPLKELVEIGLHYECVLLVDESHSLGTHGARGEGLVSSLGLAEKVHFRTASLAKAFAGRAGIITCSNSFSDYFKFTSLPAIFSSTLLPHEVIALHKTLDIVVGSHKKRARLEQISGTIRQALLNQGYPVGISKSQIIPLEAGPEKQTMELRDALEQNDIFGAVFCAPATAKSRSMVRLSLHAALTEEQIAYMLRVFEKLYNKVKPNEWPMAKRLAAI